MHKMSAAAAVGILCDERIGASGKLTLFPKGAILIKYFYDIIKKIWI